MFYVLMISEPSEGGQPYGVYSTLEFAMAAEESAEYIRGFEFATIVPFELDAPASHVDLFAEGAASRHESEWRVW